MSISTTINDSTNLLIIAVLIAIISYFFFLKGDSNDNNNSSNRNGNSGSVKKVEVIKKKKNLSSEYLDIKNKILVPASYYKSNGSNLAVDSFSITIALDERDIYNLDNKKYHKIDYLVNLLESECNVYIICEVTDDKDQQTLLELIRLRLLPSFNNSHRILFYGNQISKNAFIRQIKPLLHIEYDKNIYDNLNPHINFLLLLSNDNSDNTIKVKNSSYNIINSIDSIFRIDLNK